MSNEPNLPAWYVEAQSYFQDLEKDLMQTKFGNLTLTNLNDMLRRYAVMESGNDKSGLLFAELVDALKAMLDAYPEYVNEEQFEARVAARVVLEEIEGNEG